MGAVKSFLGDKPRRIQIAESHRPRTDGTGTFRPGPYPHVSTSLTMSVAFVAEFTFAHSIPALWKVRHAVVDDWGVDWGACTV